MVLNKNSFCFSLIFVLISCNGVNNEKNVQKENIENDTLFLLEPDGNKVFYKEELYANADNSFYDFIYLFKSDSLFQDRRISFPVKFEDGENRIEIPHEKWHFDSLLLNNVYYTQFYSSEEEIDGLSNTDTDEISLREYHQKDGKLKSYHFRKNNGKWLLFAIEWSDAEKDDFISFFANFMNDSVFQNKHIAKKLRFVTYDPEDEFSLIESEISYEQWNAFKPTIQSDIISEFDCHNRENNSDLMIASMVQIDTGYNIRFHFEKKRNGGWMLYKYEDLSN